MPIKPENIARYPAEWPAIRLQVLQRARYRCEWPGCGAQHHALGRWQLTVAGWVFRDCTAQLLAGRRQLLTFTERRALCAADLDLAQEGKLIVIVLTVAHLDHVPEHCELTNLRAWCQRHHLAYDQDHHRQTAYMSRREKANTMELPL